MLPPKTLAMITGGLLSRFVVGTELDQSPPSQYWFIVKDAFLMHLTPANPSGGSSGQKRDSKR